LFGLADEPLSLKNGGLLAFESTSGSAQNRKRSKEPLPMPEKRPSKKTARPRPILTIPELEHAKAAALGTLVSLHSRRAYKNAIDKFTDLVLL
jgi:hypothetical protein